MGKTRQFPTREDGWLWCIRGAHYQPPDAFYKRGRLNKDGTPSLIGWCKCCMKDYARKWHAAKYPKKSTPE